MAIIMAMLNDRFHSGDPPGEFRECLHSPLWWSKAVCSERTQRSFGLSTNGGNGTLFRASTG